MNQLTPNPTFDRSTQRHRRWVPVELRAPAPGQCSRSAARSLHTEWLCPTNKSTLVVC